MALNDEQWQYNIAKAYLYGYQWIQLPGYYTRVLTICICALHPLWKGRGGIIAIPNLQGTVLHSVASHWNHIFYRIFLCDVIYEFRLRISMNYTM